jgi:hypothetical protein
VFFTQLDAIPILYGVHIVYQTTMQCDTQSYHIEHTSCDEVARINLAVS